MKPLYLQNIQIDNFRPFGAGFTLSLPGPGVVILVGPNGLGKTSLFDAIEWGLTGKVVRLADSTDDIRRQNERRYYSRRQADGLLSSDCSVQLDFSEGPSIKRQIQLQRPYREASNESYSDSGTSLDVVLPLLRAPEWRLPIATDQLFTYLSQTHWLYQAAVHRFAAQPSDKRWASLSGPAGMERLNVLQERLGHRLKQNLTKKRQDYAEEVERKTTLLNEWQGLLEQKRALRSRASGGGALSPAEASAQLAALVAELSRTFSSEGAPALVELQKEALLDQRMAAVLRFIQAFDRSLAESSTRIGDASQIPDEWLKLQAENQVLAEAMHASEQTLAVARESAVRGDELIQALTEQQEQVMASLAKAEASARQRLYLTARLEEHDRLAHEIGEQLAQVERLVLATQVAGSDVEQIEQRLKDLRHAEAERRRLVAEQQRLLETRTQLERWQDREMQKPLLLLQQTALRTAIEEGAERQAGLKVALAQHELRQQQTAVTLQILSEKASTLNQALSILVAHLTEEEDSCPVCLTHFSPGELKRRSEAALQAERPELLAAERAVEEARRERQRIQSDIAAVQAEIELSRTKKAELEASISQVEAMWQTLMDSPSLSGVLGEPESIRLHLLARLEQTEQALERVAHRLADQVPDIGAMEEQLQRARVAQNESVSSLRAAEQKLRNIRQQLQEVESALASQPQLVTQLRDDEQRLVIERTSARALEQLHLQLAELAAGHAEQEQQHKRSLETCTEQERVLAGHRQSLSTGIRKLEELQRQWSTAGLPAQPDRGVIEHEWRRIHLQRPALDGAKAVHARLASGLERWDAAEQLRRTQATIESILRQTDSETEEQYFERLQEEQRRAVAELEHAAVVRRGVEWLEAGVRSVVEEYSRAVLEPVNMLAARFLRALSVFPEQHVSVVRWAQGGHPHLTLRVRSEQSELPEDLSANHLLSEGQMAAVSLSLLLAMSVAYRWSRWRGLLLDDPLQNNDIIHVSAFADVIRNLVAHQGYQVILSTHDSEISEFLARKFQAAEVPCRICRFIAPSSSGVVTEC